MLTLLDIAVGDEFDADLIIERGRAVLTEYQGRGYFGAAIIPSARHDRHL